MKPFLRATDRGRLAPVGWVSEPAGSWRGKEVEVVYDPRRHDVMFLRGDIGDETRKGFHEVGYRPVVIDGTNEMWVRDRLAVVAVAMDRVERQLAREQTTEITGRAL
jgi:hypothetical protein